MKSCGSLSAKFQLEELKTPHWETTLMRRFSISAQRFNSNGALVGVGQDAVLVEYAAGSAAYT